MLAAAKIAGRITIILALFVCSRPVGAQTQPIQYYYDDLGRLVIVVDSAGNVVTYVYDPVGNITQIKRSRVSVGSLAIFDFNPQRGPVGIAVTVRGQGFSATGSSNVVKFNGTVAKVTSATTSTLLATVPAGATTGPISVTVNANTATSSSNFVVTTLPTVTSVWPKSALFGVVVPNAQAIGTNLFDATFSFRPTGPTVNLVSVDPTGTSAVLTFSAGNTAGTYALVATSPYGANSGTVATAANRFTVVDPTSKADTDADGVPDVVEAAYGTDPLNPKSFPSSNSIPVFGGEADAMPFSVLNTAPPAGSPAATGEADALPFSVLNTAPPPGSPAATMEADGIPFSVLNTAPPPGSQAATLEADGVCFSVYNGVQAPLGLACANGTLDESISASGNKKGESHVSKTKPPAP